MLGVILDEPRIKPSRWRKQHGKIESVDDQIQDSAGNIGAPYRGLTLLEDWERSGRIPYELVRAGHRFHELFYLAHHEPLKAADMARPGGCATGPFVHHFGPLGARAAFNAALDALGGLESMLGSCAWSVLGEDRSIRHWALVYVGVGRARMDKNVATGVVLGALGALRVHFGY